MLHIVSQMKRFDSYMSSHVTSRYVTFVAPWRTVRHVTLLRREVGL